jgi:hypothetical protein
MSNNTKWDEAQDARTKGMEYPNYFIHRTPSGHTIVIDDTKDSESITIQHRSGSMIQMHPDGQVVVRSHKGKQEIIFGDNQIMISGDSDILVNGGASLKIEGDMDLTISGDYNMAISGDYNQVIKGNKNTLIQGNSEEAITGGQTTKVKKNTEHTTEGKTYIGSHDDMHLESMADMNIKTDQKLITVSADDTTITSQAKITTDSATDTKLTVGAKLDTISGDKTTMKATEIHLNPDG